MLLQDNGQVLSARQASQHLLLVLLDVVDAAVQLNDAGRRADLGSHCAEHLSTPSLAPFPGHCGKAEKWFPTD